MVHKTRIYNWYICLVAAGCMVLMDYDASVFNSVQNSDNWHAYFEIPNSHMLGLMNTVYTVDWAGRRWAMGIGCFITIIATFMQCFPPPTNPVPSFMAGRVIIGVGQALAIAAGPVYIGQVTPSYIRGLVMAFWQMFYSVGSFVAYWVNYAAGKNREGLGEWDWKMVVIFQLLQPIIIISQLPFMPESPGWLIQRRNDVEGEPVGIAIVFLMFLFAFFYKPSWGATVWIYTAEVFPMNVRAQTVGMCSQMQGVANTIFQQFLPTFYENEGLKSFFFMTCNVFLAAFVWFLIPETKKVPLEEMDTLFGGASHVQKGAVTLHEQKVVEDGEQGKEGTDELSLRNRLLLSGRQNQSSGDNEV